MLETDPSFRLILYWKRLSRAKTRQKRDNCSVANLAEREGVEPSDRFYAGESSLRSTASKAAAIDHSAISPLNGPGEESSAETFAPHSVFKNWGWVTGRPRTDNIRNDSPEFCQLNYRHHNGPSGENAFQALTLRSVFKIHTDSLPQRATVATLGLRGRALQELAQGWRKVVAPLTCTMACSIG